MTIGPPFIDWKDPPFPGEPPGAIRLARAEGGVAIYQCKVSPASDDVLDATGDQYLVTLAPIAVMGGSLPAISATQLLANDPEFDVATLENGSISVIIESFGGASNALLVGAADKGDLTVTASYDDFTDYRSPRFVRGDVAPGQLVTAIANGSALVAMSGKPLAPTDIGRKSPPFAKLADANSGVAIATSPPNGSLQAVALFAKRGDDGPSLPSGDFLGTLTLISVMGGRPTGKPIVLFDPGGTYAFDVDVQSGLALVLASTSGGPQLLSCDLASGKTAPIAWPPGYPATGTWIASPSVLAVPGDPGSKIFSIAFFEAVGSDVKGIRYAQLNLATTP